LWERRRRRRRRRRRGGMNELIQSKRWRRQSKHWRRRKAAEEPSYRDHIL
jgi:hypothetical protein